MCDNTQIFKFSNFQLRVNSCNSWTRIFKSSNFQILKSSLLTIGDEILIGQIVDTNSVFMSKQLGEIGISVSEMRSVGDTRKAIIDALDSLLPACDLLLITGGLGPTKDDITKHTLAEYFGARSMVMHEPTLHHVTELLGKRGIAMIDANRAQALVPDVCEVLLNLSGTAPGMWFERDEKVVVSMPGVPFEMEYLMANEVIPRLQKRFALGKVFHKNIITAGLPESTLANTIAGWELALPEHLKLAYLPSYAGVRLRLSCYNADAHPDIESDVCARITQLRTLIADHIVGFDSDTLESVVASLLAERCATLATAESCTGGRIAALLTAQAGASRYFKGSVVAYANEVKIAALGVCAGDIAQQGAVCQTVAEQMAQGAQRLLGADYAVATTGIAGPTGGTPQKPVGTVWTAIATPHGLRSQLLCMGGDRERIIARAAYSVLNLLRKAMLEG
jgi:nicotinamide-nucleotide amidase